MKTDGVTRQILKEIGLRKKKWDGTGVGSGKIVLQSTQSRTLPGKHNQFVGKSLGSEGKQWKKRVKEP